MATGIGAYVIETDGSVHEMISAGDGDWKDEEVGNILTDVFNSRSLVMLIGFEVGKYYKHVGTNKMIHCLTIVDTEVYGKAIIAESTRSPEPITVVGIGPGYRDNWIEIKEDEWKQYWSKKQ